MIVGIAYACYIPDPSSSPLPSPSIEPSPSPSEEPKCEEDCQSPNPSPIPQPTPQGDALTPASPGGPSPEKTCEKIEFTPTILTFNRLSPTEIKITWSKTDPIDNYQINYGLSKDSLIWNTRIEHVHEITLGNLPANESIWVGVQGWDGYCVGQMSLIVDP